MSSIAWDSLEITLETFYAQFQHNSNLVNLKACTVNISLQIQGCGDTPLLLTALAHSD